MGQLGFQKDNQLEKFGISFLPEEIEELKSKRVTSISAGDGHSMVVSSNGIAYSFGASACGQLGLDRKNNMLKDSEGYPFQYMPSPVTILKNFKVKEIACGDAHTIALIVEGKLYSWGGAGCGQLGHPNINEMRKDSDGCPYQPRPKFIEGLAKNTINKISCGKAHSLAIDSDGKLFSWGAGACGQLGFEGFNLIRYLQPRHGRRRLPFPTNTKTR